MLQSEESNKQTEISTKHLAFVFALRRLLWWIRFALPEVRETCLLEQPSIDEDEVGESEPSSLIPRVRHPADPFYMLTLEFAQLSYAQVTLS